MDDSGHFGAEFSFSEFLRGGEINIDLPGVSMPDVGSQPYKQSESEQRESDQFEPSVGGDAIDNHVTDDSSFIDASTTTFDINRSVRIALQGQSVAVPKQLWESGVWQSIFSERSPLETFNVNVFGQELHRPSGYNMPAELEEDVGASKKSSRVQKRYDQVVKLKPDLTWKEQTDAALQSSIKLWCMLIGRWKDTCAMYIELHIFRWESDALTMLLDIFAARSPYTLRKRALALMHMCDYLEENWQPAFPIDERLMYAFLCAERELGAPTSRLKGYMQAVTFCRFVLDLKELDPVINSARCRGTTKPKNVVEKNQASPLRVDEVRQLHDCLMNGAELWDRMFSGAALFCLYARST